MKAQKKGGLSFQPMGKLRGMPRMGSGRLSEGRITASWSAACALTGTR